MLKRLIMNNLVLLESTSDARALMSLIIVSIEFKFEKNLLSDIKDMSEISSNDRK